MKKFLALLIGIISLSSFIAFASDSGKLELTMAENCRSREECVDFEEKGELLTRDTEIKQGEQFMVDIVIKNPEGLPINSIASWIKYDPTVFKAINIETDDSPFELASPDGDKINSKEGLVQIGRAAPGNAILESEIIGASVVFEVKTDQKISSMLEFFNYQQTELGQTGVFSTSGLFTENILKEEPKKLRVYLNGLKPSDKEDTTSGGNQNNDNTTDGSGNNNTTGSIETNESDQLISGGVIPRPNGLRIESQNGQAKLIWEMGNNPNIIGYYAYYSTQSGMYLFRRDVARTNNTLIDNLENGKQYYFAITAYDTHMNETDFSDEVYAIIGDRNSESHPYFGNIVSKNVTVPGEKLMQPGGKTGNVGPESIAYLALGITLLMLAIIRSRFYTLLLPKR